MTDKITPTKHYYYTINFCEVYATLKRYPYDPKETIYLGDYKAAKKYLTEIIQQAGIICDYLQDEESIKVEESEYDKQQRELKEQEDKPF